MNSKEWVLKHFGADSHGLMSMVGAVGECQLHFPEQVTIAVGESVIKCPSPLNVLKDTYDHSCD